MGYKARQEANMQTLQKKGKNRVLLSRVTGHLVTREFHHQLTRYQSKSPRYQTLEYSRRGELAV